MLITLILSLFFNPSNHTLSVKVSNLKNTDAPIYMAVYKSPSDFLNNEKMYSGAKLEPKGSKEPVLKVELPEGQYALAIFQDINENGKLDTNILGIPKEPYGFSKNFRPVFSAPAFEDCAIDVRSDSGIYSIRLLQ